MTSRRDRNESERLRRLAAAIQARDGVTPLAMAVRLGFSVHHFDNWLAGAYLPVSLQRRVRLVLGDEAGAP